MSKIVVSVENHNCIFKKPKENDAEIIFYNTDYFKQIGFPDAEVIIGTTETDGTMKGGYYKNPDTLTYPFRHLVYLIQGNKKTHINTPIEPTPTENRIANPLPNFFERLGNYGKEATNMISTGLKNMELFNTKKTPVSINPVSEIESTESSLLPTPVLEPAVSETSLLQTSPVSPTPVSETEQNESKTHPMQYYKVIIPIHNPISKVPLGTHEKEELLLNYLILENKVEKSLGKSNSGKLYKVGNRYIRMCEEVKEWSSLKTPPSTLIGTKMYKMGNVSNK